MIEDKRIEKFIRKHNYLVFSFFALALVLVLLWTPQSAKLSAEISLILALGFLGWSLIHHYYDKSLNTEVMLEYLLTIGLVLVSVVYFLI